MRVFVDECVTKKLMPFLTGHSFIHATDTALRSTKNGALLRAVSADFEVFLTTDRNVPFQQNLKTFPLVFVILHSVSSRLDDLMVLVPETLMLLDRISQLPLKPGELYEIVTGQ